MNGKTIAAAVAIVMLSVAFFMGYRHGAKSVRAQMYEDRIDSINRAIEQGRALAEQEYMAAQAGARVITRVKTEIRYVERAFDETATPACHDLGPDWLRHYNAAIDAANLPGTAAPAGSASGDGNGAGQHPVGDWIGACQEHGDGCAYPSATDRTDPGRAGTAGRANPNRLTSRGSL